MIGHPANREPPLPPHYSYQRGSFRERIQYSIIQCYKPTGQRSTTMAFHLTGLTDQQKQHMDMLHIKTPCWSHSSDSSFKPQPCHVPFSLRITHTLNTPSPPSFSELSLLSELQRLHRVAFALGLQPSPGRSESTEHVRGFCGALPWGNTLWLYDRTSYAQYIPILWSKMGMVSR